MGTSEIQPKHVLLSQYKHWGHIDIMASFALDSGYPYFEWNDRVYKTPKSGSYLSAKDTGLIYSKDINKEIIK
jgi:hypothetical protein